MNARERMVRVVAEALIKTHGGSFLVSDAELSPALSKAVDFMLGDAEAVVSALESEMNLRIETEPSSKVVFSGPNGSLTLDGPAQMRLVTDWVSDEEDEDIGFGEEVPAT